MKRLYQGDNCPCPSDCTRRTNCKACIAFHHSRGEQTYCEYLYKDVESDGAPPSDVPVKSGRELRLMDYGPCAG